MKKNKTYVHYVDDSTPKLKLFKSLKSAKTFVTKFLKAHPDPMEGYWVDFLVIGKIIPVDPDPRAGMKTLKEFIEGHGPVKNLAMGLTDTVNIYGDRMTGEEKVDLLRVSLVLVRQCLQDFGVE